MAEKAPARPEPLSGQAVCLSAIDVSGEHYKNKLSAVIEKLEDKSPSKSMVGSNVIYLLDWMDNLTDLQCKGVHHEVTRQDATRCIIQTYICLGDILSLQDE